MTLNAAHGDGGIIAVGGVAVEVAGVTGLTLFADLIGIILWRVEIVRE